MPAEHQVVAPCRVLLQPTAPPGWLWGRLSKTPLGACVALFKHAPDGILPREFALPREARQRRRLRGVAPLHAEGCPQNVEAHP